jgi:phosphopantothenoylcysteine synthetase/decarboxylase
MQHMADLHMARKNALCQQHLIISHASTAYLEERKRKLIFRKKKSNHIKRKIDVPLGQGTDDDDGDDDDDDGKDVEDDPGKS